MKKLIYSFYFLLLMCGSAVAQVPTSGLVAYYPFDNYATDESGHGLNGTINTSGVTLTTGYDGTPNSAYNFDGSSGFISFPSVPTINATNFSISAWISPASLNQFGFAVSNGADNATSYGDGYGIGIGKYLGPTSGATGNNLVGIYSGLSMFNGNYTFSTAWHHVAMISSPTGTLTFYVDGVVQATYSGVTAHTPTSFSIGAELYHNVGARFFNGIIDEVRVYNRALSQCEINELANTSLPEPTIASAPAAAVCAGSSTTFTINPVSGATNYTWYVDNVLQTGNSTSISPTLGVGSHYILVTANSQCSPKSTKITSPPLFTTVNVLSTPATPGTISPRNGVSYACLNTVKFYTVPTVPSATGYQWTLNGTVLTDQDGNNAAITLATAGANSLSVKAYSSSNGTFCYSPSSNPTAITVNSGPLTPTIVGNTQSCQYTGTNFSAVINSKSTLINAYTVSPADPTATYTWATDNGVLNTIATGKKGVIAYVNFPDIPSSSQSVLNYTMSVSATNLCGSTLVQLPNAVVNNNFPVKPTIKCTDATCATLTLGQTIPNSSLTWTVYNPSGKTTYTNVTSIPNPGNVQIQLTVYNGTAGPTNVAACPYSAWYRPCDGTTGPYGTSSGRLAEQLTLPEESSYLIYPNPSTGTVTIETKGQAGKAYIFNTLGQEIAEVTLTENEYIYTVNLSSKGLYTFKIMSGSETAGYKVVVE